MKELLYNLLRLALPMLALSCEAETDWNLQTGDEFIVADCIITNELKYQELLLYWSSGHPNHTPEGFSGVTAELSDGNNTFTFSEDLNQPGHYVSVNPFMASAGKNYRLTLSYGDHADTAYASMIGVAPLDVIEITPSDDYFRLTYHESSPASMTEVHYDWSGDPLYCEKYGSNEAAEVFYSLDNIDIGKQFPPDKQIILFPHGTQIIRKKYSLNDDHQRFVRSLLLETEWRGGLFDVEQGNVPTNFQHGVRGWFAACAVVTDTTNFQ
jgi:hypothetical protein